MILHFTNLLSYIGTHANFSNKKYSFWCQWPFTWNRLLRSLSNTCDQLPVNKFHFFRTSFSLRNVVWGMHTCKPANLKLMIVATYARANGCKVWRVYSCLILPVETTQAGTFSIGSTTRNKADTEANNGTYCLQKRIEKFPLWRFQLAPRLQPCRSLQYERMENYDLSSYLLGHYVCHPRTGESMRARLNRTAIKAHFSE